jgi:hypothetical protein
VPWRGRVGVGVAPVATAVAVLASEQGEPAHLSHLTSTGADYDRHAQSARASARLNGCQRYSTT